MTLKRLLIHFFLLVYPLITLGEKETAFFPKNQVFFVTAFFIFGLTIFQSWKQKRPLTFPLIFIPILLASLWAICTTTFSTFYQPFSLTLALSNMNPELLFCFFWLVGSLNLFASENDRKETSFYLLGGMFLPILAGLFQYLQTFQFSLSPEEFRLFIFGTYENPVIFAAALLPPVFIALNSGLQESSWKRWPLFTGASLGIFLILATLARSVWLAGAIGLILFVFKRHHVLRKNWQPVLYFLLLSLIALFILRGQITGRVQNSTLPSQSSASVVRRLAIWQSGLKTFMDHPILGSGSHTFEIAVLKHRDLRLNNDPTLWESPFYAENFLLRSLVEIGFSGTLLIGLFFLGVIFSLQREKAGWSTFFLAAFVYFITALQTETTLFPLFIFISLIPLKHLRHFNISLKVAVCLILFSLPILFLNLNSLEGVIVSPYPQTYFTFTNQSLLESQLILSQKGYSVAPQNFHTQAALFNRTADMVLWGNKQVSLPAIRKTNNPLVLLSQARLSLSTNNLITSAALLNQLKTLNDNDPRVWNLQGVLSAKQNQPNKARVFFLKALSLKKDYIPAIHNLGVVTKNKENLNLASTFFEKYNHFAYFPDSNTLDY